MPIHHFVSTFASWLGTGLVAASAGYAVAALGAALKNMHDPAPPLGASDCVQPISVLKPLHGAEPRLYENLRSFCQQAHPNYQLIFGVREPQDPAIAVVHRLRAEFPQLAIDLVVDPRVHGANLKVSNLLNMLPLARHDWLVLADSDISVPADYLSRVTAPLADAGVGIVTCLYYGVPQDGFWARLGCLFIDDWFAPSVRLSHASGSTRFAFGSTIALRREALQSIGGFEALRDTLADDFWLGELTRQAGLRTVLSDLVVGTEVSETRLTELWAHELRWLRTIRAIAPGGFAMSFVCFTWPVSLLGLTLAPSTLSVWLAMTAGSARVARFFLGRKARRPSMPWYEVLLTPFRDLLLLLEWAVALTSWRVKWRGQVLHAHKDRPMRYP
ncbi:bacteriohopanetetrol glucosamine biosynthesis glycosyltransferase HpnI [Azotobacter beijerinckii]|uniref:Ceramide glucosyltransferase n=1 Tax=Azotobacter beijerinckii TaxID=170623 RepID=A0A1I4FTD5_9GAMM|nr:bacteriohopanetetrol glucosamine biosynthesis glycosyltransferase HpnI [Azotobacter beijerinckii]SFB54016.1 ceramide glucosyltransferase [Azotobacter beijerinckii]SFL20823.1 ceramide glucosyltransferase [Azotobacter beijerinckii]